MSIKMKLQAAARLKEVAVFISSGFPEVDKKRKEVLEQIKKDPKNSDDKCLIDYRPSSVQIKEIRVKRIRDKKVVEEWVFDKNGKPKK